MIISSSDTQQDTARVIKIVIKESIRLKTYSLPEVRQFPSKDVEKHVSALPSKSLAPLLTDTTSVCSRNIISDVTFFDPNNLITTIKPGSTNVFPFLFTEKNRLRQTEAKTTLERQLKTGLNIPVQPLHDDWIILIILISAFIYSLIRSTSKSMLPDVVRFFLFRGINDPVSRDIGGLFNWQSTILNLATFLIIGLFSYCFALFSDFMPSAISGINGYFISLAIIISVVTIRHIACLIIGIISGERDAFREYIVGIYLSYRFSALILFIIVILLSYTVLLPAKLFFISGIVALCIMYVFRIIRLLIIFINRNISIFYLILYLCALEILPVGISVKYFTGLF